MKHVKKILLAITALALVLSLSGCYWEGKTKLHSEQLLLDELEEKYNEEFIIRQIGVSSARSGGPLVAYCSPKDDEELVFETELYQFGDNISLRDMYIQSIVRREMKEQIYSVLSKYYDNFASEVHVWGLAPEFNSGITDADYASIVTYTEALSETNESHIWIAVDKDDISDINDIEHFKNLLNQACSYFHYSATIIDFYVVSNQIIKECNDQINNNYDTMSMTTILSTGRCLDDSNYLAVHIYSFLGGSNGLEYVRTVNQSGSKIIE